MEECCEPNKKGSIKLPAAPKPPAHTFVYVLAALAIGLLLFNQYEIAKISSTGLGITGATIASPALDIVPTCTPAIYGKELKISYDDVSPDKPQAADATIDVLGNLDKTITLSGAGLQRYIDIVSQISCEYCCGAQSIIVTEADVTNQDQKIDAAVESGQITADQAGEYRKTAGDAACGCAHSFAMRGLAKYLITKHNSEYTDDQILEELGKWKILFFPDIMQQKANILSQKGIELNYINLASNKYRGVEQGATEGGMVGGC